MAKAKTVSDKIRDYYVADNGEWLVEKGKVKEARLLKEAYHRIVELEEKCRDLEYKLWEEKDSVNERIEEETSHLEKQLEKAKDKAWDLDSQLETANRLIERIKNMLD